ncbi:hypothetical protein SLEP1_g14027 [Rubroshorea leprosula]|uniref:Uncharacterized protein n=1 Tax=Rubroshorea leprosula TaxID=152421 RepID=A0AAV5ITC3_9ROSI|nr:hypothetical protein SLEP1_g14027 [Rubroshorea leprosula]
MFPYVTKDSKIYLWRFEEYSNMIYLEGDIQVFDNIDSPFDLPDCCIYVPLGCSCTGAGSQCPESSKWPTELGPKPGYYNSASMFLFEPDTSILYVLLTMLQRINRSQLIPSLLPNR